MARKKQRSDELLAPDAFQQQGSGWSKWLEKNIRLVLVAVAAVLVGIVGAEFITSQSQRSASAMTSRFGDALDQYREATDPSFVQTATSADVVEQKKNRAKSALKNVRDSTDASGASRLALLYEADLARSMDDEAEAAALYEDYLQRAPSDDPLRFLALEGAGYAHEEQENWDAALRHFVELERVSFYEQWALKHQARVYEAMGDVSKAVDTLERLLETEPDAFLKNYAESKLKLLR